MTQVILALLSFSLILPLKKEWHSRRGREQEECKSSSSGHDLVTVSTTSLQCHHLDSVWSAARVGSSLLSHVCRKGSLDHLSLRAYGWLIGTEGRAVFFLSRSG